MHGCWEVQGGGFPGISLSRVGGDKSNAAVHRRSKIAPLLVWSEFKGKMKGEI